MRQKQIAIVVQARCGSERLPNKVLLPLGGKTVIEHVLAAVKASSLADTVVLATTTNRQDDPLVMTAAALNVRVYRGSEQDVLERFVRATEHTEAEIIVRITADDPLLDPRIIDHVIAHYLKGGCDYASNIIERSWPRGVDTEVFSRTALLTADKFGLAPEHREHVTIFIRTRADLFTLRSVTARPEERWPDLRLCIDTNEDYNLLQRIFKSLPSEGGPVPLLRVLDWLRAHPEVAAINSDIRQKKVFGREF
jgi:spore coat polysaccharide biosynthesis protein SpsF